MKQLIETVETLRMRGIGFRSLTEALDTTTAQGRLVFHMFGALAEFERSLIRERTHAGLAAARRAGGTGGRPPKLTEDDIEAVSSTFITSVLRSLGFEVLKYDEWPERPEDVAFGQKIVDMLRAAHANEDHIQAVRADIGARRFRPDEVVGATTLSAWPVAFVEARAIAKAVIMDLKVARSTAS